MRVCACVHVCMHACVFIGMQLCFVCFSTDGITPHRLCWFSFFLSHSALGTPAETADCPQCWWRCAWLHGCPSQVGAALGLPNPSFPSVGRSEGHGGTACAGRSREDPLEPCHQQGCPAASSTETSGPFVAAALPWLRRPPLRPPMYLSVPSRLPCVLETRVRLILLSSARPFGTHALPKVPWVTAPFLRGPTGCGQTLSSPRAQDATW